MERRNTFQPQMAASCIDRPVFLFFSPTVLCVSCSFRTNGEVRSFFFHHCVHHFFLSYPLYAFWNYEERYKKKCNNKSLKPISSGLQRPIGGQRADETVTRCWNAGRRVGNVIEFVSWLASHSEASRVVEQRRKRRLWRLEKPRPIWWSYTWQRAFTSLKWRGIGTEWNLI